MIYKNYTRTSWIFLVVLPIASSSIAVEERFSDHQLIVGLASTDITPPIGVPLAGHSGKTRRMSVEQKKQPHQYATRFKPSQGVRDPLRSKAMFLENETGKLLFINMDLVAVTKVFRDAVFEHVKDRGIRWDDIFISATHTHSGPGNLSKNMLWNLLTMDSYKEEIYQHVLGKTLKAVDLAMEHAAPANLFAGRFKDTVGIQKNRANRPGYMDNQGKLLLAKNRQGDWLGGMINFAVHGISMPPQIPLFSADLPGEIERKIEDGLVKQNLTNKRVTIMFMQAHSGDINPVAREEALMVEQGRQFGDIALAATNNMCKVAPTWQVKSGKYYVGRSDINIPNCIDAGEIKLNKQWQKKVAVEITATPLSLFFPKMVWVSTLVLDDIVMFQWPGELTTEMGITLKDVAGAFGYKDGWILGLTNNHLSYFGVPEEYYRPEYEACAFFTGPDGGYFIAKKHILHLREMVSNH